ncbi:MAG: class I SAM-dependent methyltransferase [Candidatus Dormibacterales bacterium]
MRGKGRVRDDPLRPDPEYARLYASLPYETRLQPWLGWASAAGGPVLYLGVGAARLAAPLAGRGVDLVGVDSHPGMLAEARRRLPGTELVQSRIEDLDLGRRFPLVMGPAGVLASAPRLTRAAAHARASGRVAFELVNPHWVRAGAGPGFRVLAWRDDRTVEVEVDYAPPRGGVVTESATLALLEPHEVEDRLWAAGLELVLLKGAPRADLDSSPSFYVVGMPARKRLRRLQMPST